MRTTRYIGQQTPTISALIKLAAAGTARQLTGTPPPPELPGRVVSQQLEPRSRELVRDYVRHVGGAADKYVDSLPPHMFPQWTFAAAAETLLDLPYPLNRVLNGGCRAEVRRPLPIDRPLHVKAQLMSIDENDRRALLHQRLTTLTDEGEEAIVADMYPVIMLGGSGGGSKRKERAPVVSREVRRWSLPSDAGKDFAALTGDFNPIHWVDSYARIAGFPRPILHGFAQTARVWEAFEDEQGRAIEVLDVRFRRPLVLPHDVGLYADDDGGFCLADCRGARCYLTGEVSFG